MHRRLRVLHILPSVNGYGAERIIVELVRRLPSTRVEAALLTIYAPDPSALLDLPFRVLTAARNGRRDIGFVLRMVRAIRAFRPDLVHAHTHVGKYWGRLAAILAGVPIVFTEHNPCDTRRSAIERVADPLLHAFTRRVVTFSAEQGALLARTDRLAPSKVAIIPNGLVETVARPTERVALRRTLNVRDDEVALLLVGRMEYQKNHALALRALASLREPTRTATTLLFAGNGVESVALRELATQLGIADRVHFLGYRSDVPDLMRACDIVVMTSFFEGMPLTLIEAMLAGTPILTTPWTGAASMLGDGRYGFIAPDFSPEGVARTLETMIASPEACRRLAVDAKLCAQERFRMSTMVDEHRALYEQLAAGGR